MTNFPRHSRQFTIRNIRRPSSASSRRAASIKRARFMAASEDWARDYKKRGFNMLAAGPDQALLAAGMRGILASVADA